MSSAVAALPAAAADSRPPSRAAHMRPVMAPVVAHPAAGAYDGPLVVRLHCSTPGAEIRFTRDGTTPYANSDRDHGYRCERYSAKAGIVLQGKGRHVITAIATARSCVEGRPARFAFRLLSGDEPPKPRATVIKEAMMNRQFALTATHSNAMPFHFARARSRSPRPLQMALADTSSPRKLEALREKGYRVELFRTASGVNTATTSYRRVVPPSLNVAMPTNPLEKPRRSRPDSRGTPDGAALTYTMPMLLSSHVATVEAGDLGAVVPYGGGAADDGLASYLSSSLPGSRLQTPGAGASRPHSRATTRLPQRRAASAMATYQQLTWFEARGQLTGAHSDDDREEVENELRYQTQCGAAMEAEITRVGRISERFGKAYTMTNPITRDIAADSRRLLSFLMHAAAVRRTALRRLLTLLSYRDIEIALDRRVSVTPVELHQISGGALPQNELAKALREIGAPSGESDSKTAVPVANLLLLLRYTVWVARPIPEAVLALALQFKTELPSVTERTMTRTEAVALVDAYRRTRGAHPLAVARLQDAVHSGIKWPEGEDIELGVWRDACYAVPIIDAALLELATPNHDMYSQPLPRYL
jgi:hypothetical protein